jgi:hypothetical protein
MLWSFAAMLKAVVPIIFAEIPADDRDRFWLRGTPSADTWPSESTGFFMERWGKWYDERRGFCHQSLYSIEPVWFKTSETPTFTSRGVVEEVLRRLGQLKIPEVHDFERSLFGDTDGLLHRGYRLHHSPCRGVGLVISLSIMYYSK